MATEISLIAAQPVVTRSDAADVDAAVPLRLRIGWGLGSFPTILMNHCAMVLALRFMTDTLGIAATGAAMIYAIAKVWHALADGIIGYLCDRIATPWGRRLPWMLVGGLISTGMLVAIFSAPMLAPAQLRIYMLGAILAFATGYATFKVPYMALPVDITESYHGRTQLMSFRVLFVSLATMVAMGAGPMLLGAWGATREGYARMALLMAAVAAVTVLLCVWLLRNVPSPALVVQQRPKLSYQLRTAFEHRAFMRLMLAKLAYFFGSGLMLASFAYFTKYVLKVSDLWLGGYLGLLSVGMIASQPLWLYVARRSGKRNGFLLAGAVSVAGLLSWFGAGAGEPIALLVSRALFIGVGSGGMFMLSQAMLPDTLEYDARRTGLQRSGIFTGIYVMVEQVGVAVALASIGVLLGALGYVHSTGAGRVEQPEAVLFGIYLCVSAAPAVAFVLAMVAIWGYDLSEEKLKSTPAFVRPDSQQS
jgi:glycoside/pentoside/hexuronide:cation symporter, GPH family